MPPQKEEKFEMTIDDHESKSPKSSSLEEDTAHYESNRYNRTPSRGSTTRWPRGINEKKLIRKIDWTIIPILMAAYFLQFLDKVVYNVSYLRKHPLSFSC
jgi:hypothetical protein